MRRCYRNGVTRDVHRKEDASVLERIADSPAAVWHPLHWGAGLVQTSRKGHRGRQVHGGPMQAIESCMIVRSYAKAAGLLPLLLRLSGILIDGVRQLTVPFGSNIAELEYTTLYLRCTDQGEPAGQWLRHRSPPKMSHWLEAGSKPELEAVCAGVPGGTNRRPTATRTASSFSGAGVARSSGIPYLSLSNKRVGKCACDRGRGEDG